jgi:hypothetical protein
MKGKRKKDWRRRPDVEKPTESMDNGDVSMLAVYPRSQDEVFVFL